MGSARIYDFTDSAVYVRARGENISIPVSYFSLSDRAFATKVRESLKVVTEAEKIKSEIAELQKQLASLR